MAETLRIGLLIHSLDGGGAEPVARLWIEELARRGHHVVCMVYGPTTYQSTDVAIEVVAFPGRSTIDRWTRLPGWVRRTARACSLDTVVSLLDFSNITLLRAFAGRSGKPALVITEHTVPDLMWRHEGAGGHAKRLLAKVLYRRADAVVAVSHAVATDLRVAYAVSAERLFVLPNAIRDVVDAVEAPGDSQSQSPVSTVVEPRVLYVGRLTPEKRPDRFLETMLELRGRGIAWRGLVIGAGPAWSDLQATVQWQGLPVDFAGWVQPWQQLVHTGDCVLLTSDVEGLGNVLIEAAAAGVPCVAPSTALGVADALLPGVTGVLARSSRPADLADAVIEAAAMHWEPADIAPWLLNFSPEVATGRLEDILRSVTGTGTGISDEGVPSVHVVTQFGPPPGIQGGMSSVLTDYSRMTFAGYQVGFCPSYADNSRLWSTGPFLRALARVTMQPRPEIGIVHVHLSQNGSFVREGGIVLAASRRGLPVVVTLHGANLKEFNDSHPHIVDTVLRQADVIITLGSAFRNLLAPDLRTKVVTVPNAVMVPSVPPPAAGGNGPVALFAGEVSRRKGVDILVQAWPRAREIAPDARLELAGPPGDFDPVAVAGIEWLGPLPREEILSRLTTCRIAVLPSRHEAMPIFLLEAMAAGRPVVSTPVGEIADLVADAGLIVPEGDAVGLAAALGQLLAEPEEASRLGRMAWERVLDRNGLAAVAAQLEAVYDRAARRHTGSLVTSKTAPAAATGATATR